MPSEAFQGLKRRKLSGNSPAALPCRSTAHRLSEMRHEAEAIRVADGASNQPHTLTSSILTAPIIPDRDEID